MVVGFVGGEGEVLACEDFDREGHGAWLCCVVRCRGSVWSSTTAVGRRFEDVAACACEHPFVDHRAFVAVLPVQSDHLNSLPPEEGWVEVCGG